MLGDTCKGLQGRGGHSNKLGDKCKREVDTAVRSWETCKGLQHSGGTAQQEGRQKGDKKNTVTNKKRYKKVDKRRLKADTVTNKKGDQTGDKRRQKGDKADTTTNKKGKGDKPDGSRTRCPAARRTLLKKD